MPWLPWILLPVVGALIGYATNWVAIRMLFHPRQRKLGMQGLLPRRQAELAATIGTVVSEDLIRIETLLEPLQNLDLEPHVAPILDKVIAKKVGDLQSIPLIGSMITPDRLSGLRDAVLREITAHRADIMSGVAKAAADHVDIAAIVEAKVAGLDLEDLERVVHKVARTEFRAIEWWGAILGLLIGLIQALILFALGQ
ncbi:MAG: DUF445 family protein [Planctomycetota bacterium]|jgi:uncharacterized membrane protein YheB (UPF0754 family)|nr:DUF445 family protein [Planctomycetota bacterium]